MTEEDRAEIIATPVRDLAPRLIKEYSNSAHGVPTDLDDLTALLPRYMDLMAQDKPVDWHGFHCELRRFGEARAAGGFPTPVMAAVMDQWAQAMILHFGTLQANGDVHTLKPLYLTETLITGGWDVAIVTTALDQLFAHPLNGRAALCSFLLDLGHIYKGGGLKFWSIANYRPDARPALAAWLNHLLTSDVAIEVLTDPTLAPDINAWTEALLRIGPLTPDMLTD